MQNIKLSIPRQAWREAEAIKKQLLDLADGADGQKFYLDLEEVEFLTAALLGTLVTLHSRIEQSGGKLVLLNVNPFVYEIFSVTQLIKIINIRPRMVA